MKPFNDPCRCHPAVRQSIQIKHLEKHVQPANFLFLNLLAVPHEDTCQGGEQSPSGRMLVLESAPYGPHQAPPGALGVQVGVQLADLTGTPEPLPGHEAAVVREYGEQALPLLAWAGGGGGLVRTCPLEPGQQQAHVPAQPRHLVQLPAALRDAPPERAAAAPEPHGAHSHLADRPTGNGVEHDGFDRDTMFKGKNKTAAR